MWEHNQIKYFRTEQKKKCTNSTLVSTLIESCPSVQLNTTEYCGTTIPLECPSRCLYMWSDIHLKFLLSDYYIFSSYFYDLHSRFHIQPYFYDYVKYIIVRSRFFCMYAAKDSHQTVCVVWTHIRVLYPWDPQSCMTHTHTQVSCVKNVCLLDFTSELEMCWFNNNIINWQLVNHAFRIHLMLNQTNHNMRHKTQTKSCRFWNTCCNWSPNI